MNRKRLLQAASLFLILAPAVAMSGDDLSLKEIMQGLRNNLIEISDGLLTDDFMLVKQGATSIAEHPRVSPAEIKLVASALGPEMAAYKQLDTVVHDLSLEISDAAKALDGDAANSGFLRLIEGCLDCHRSYQERVAAVLSPDQHLL